MRVLTGCLALVALAGAPLTAQQKPEVLRTSLDSVARESREVAARSLRTFAELVNETNFRVMGFESPAEVGTATVGDPLVRFYVRLDRLREYREGTDPFGLLSGGESVIYPVLVGDKVRSSMILEKKPEGWQTVSYGGPQAVRQLAGARDSARSREKAPERKYFSVRVPALALEFLAALQDDSLTWIPLTPDPKGRWKAGEALPAGRVLGELVADAKAHNGLPI